MKSTTRGQRSNTVRIIGIASLAGISLIAYEGVRAAATRPAGELGSLRAIGKTPMMLSGTTLPVTVARPSGEATFNVVFPTAFRTPPIVTIAVVGGGNTPVIGRLSAPATMTGFQGIVTAPYFLARQDSATVSVNWIAVGEGAE